MEHKTIEQKRASWSGFEVHIREPFIAGRDVESEEAFLALIQPFNYQEIAFAMEMATVGVRRTTKTQCLLAVCPGLGITSARQISCETSNKDGFAELVAYLKATYEELAPDSEQITLSEMRQHVVAQWRTCKDAKDFMKLTELMSQFGCIVGDGSEDAAKGGNGKSSKTLSKIGAALE